MNDFDILEQCLLTCDAPESVWRPALDEIRSELKQAHRDNAGAFDLPFEDRKRICNFMNMERIRELERQKRIHREAIADIDETIRLTRAWMYRPETKN